MGAVLGILHSEGVNRLPEGQSQRRVAGSARPVLQWHVDGQGRGSPDVDHAAVYALSRGHRLLALERTTGRRLWEAQVGVGDENPGARVVAAGEAVVAGDYDLIAVDRRSGRRLWTFTPPDGYGAGLYLGTVAGGTVLTGSPVGRVYAIEARTGVLRWSTAIAGDRSARTTVFPPVVDDRFVLARFTTFDDPPSGGVAAVDRSSGRLVWRWSLPAPAAPASGAASAGGPIVVGDLVVAAKSDGTLYALNRDSGEPRWSIDSANGNRPMTVPFLDFRSLIGLGKWFVAGSLTGSVTAYMTTRERRWEFITDEGSVGFSLAVNGRWIFVPYLSGVMVALDPESGRERWRLGDWRTGFTSPPASFGNCLYLSSASTGFYAYCQEKP